MTQRTADDLRRDIQNLNNRIVRTGNRTEKWVLFNRRRNHERELAQIERNDNDRAG